MNKLTVKEALDQGHTTVQARLTVATQDILLAITDINPDNVTQLSDGRELCPNPAVVTITTEPVKADIMQFENQHDCYDPVNAYWLSAPAHIWEPFLQALSEWSQTNPFTSTTHHGSLVNRRL